MSEQAKALARIIRPWTLCDDGGRFDHGSEQAAYAVLGSDWFAAMLDQARAEVDSRIRKAILQPHVRASTDAGPDYCSTCSEAIHDWVKWPCAATEPARAEVVRDVEAAIGLATERDAHAGVRATLARHAGADQ